MADEVNMSIEETNRLRASLGLAPLREGPAKSQQPVVQQAPKPAGPSAEELAARVAERSAKRRREAELKATKTLGASGDDVDDLAAWAARVNTNAAAEGATAAGTGRSSKRQKKPAAAAGDEGEEHTAADLAGMKVRHDLENLTEGEGVVLTLADTGILDDKGNLADGPDTLENALVEEQRARRKARDAAVKKAKPLWEEDGKVRGLLDKYDQEEEEAVAAFDAAGGLGLSERQRQRQAELASKLAAGAAALLGEDGSANGAAAAGRLTGGGGDYMTAEEAAAGSKGGDKKKKKKRKLRTTQVAGEDEEAGGGLDLDALEAAAAAEGAADLGSRAAREERRKQQQDAKAAAAAERAARFQAALSKVNAASESLRPSAAAAAAAKGADDADDELEVSLARARRLAAAKDGGSSEAAAEAGEAAAAGGSKLGAMARELAIKREQDEQELRQQLAQGGAEAFSETAEFVRSIQPLAPKAEDGSSYMDVDEQPPAAAAAVRGDASMLPPPPPTSKPPLAPKQRNYRKGGWAPAADDEQANGDDEGDGDGQHSRQRPAPELEDTGVVGERAMGKGLAATLGLIKDKGLLKDKTHWAGRNNDKKPVALIGLEDVYTGGSHEDAMSQRIETALTQRDEFGRVMTPKERFRVMCHQFHGKPPSKNKQEQRQKKYLEEQAVLAAATSENPSAELDKMKELQRQTGSAYIPLTGKLKPSSNTAGLSDEPSGFQSARTIVAATPVLGGGLTPLSGTKKVEMMLGITKGGSSGSGSMPPPAPRR